MYNLITSFGQILVSPLFLTLTVLYLIYAWRRDKKLLNHWKSKGITYFPPATGKQGKKFGGTQVQEIYNDLKSRNEKFGGWFFRKEPVLIPVDLDFIKLILIKDFDAFRNRDLMRADKSSPLSEHLFSIKDDQWRYWRTKLTPTFTSGKMKMMFPTFLDCTTGFKHILEEHATTGEPLDAKEILARFTTDIITSCAFGIECNSINNPDEPFRKYGKKYLDLSPITRIMRLMIMRNLPRALWKVFNLKLMDQDIEDFFIESVRSIVEYREKNNVYRPDFMHLLIQLKNLGKVTDDTKVTENNQTKTLLSINQVAAQSFIFFVAGFETSSSTMTFGLYELAKNQDVQDKIREEVRRVLKKYDGKFTYEAINEMTYLEQAVKETLRLYPSLFVLGRECSKTYQLPGTDVILEKGSKIRIPVWAIHRDSELYPNPDKFDPERFTKENESQRHPMAWLPFGEGPRICIGLRFGLMQVKVGMATLLKDFRVTLNEKTPDHLTFAAAFFLTRSEEMIMLNIEKVN